MKRRVALVLGIAGLMLVVVAGVALAASISCAGNGKQCPVGTNGSDQISGTQDTDIATGASGGDTIGLSGGQDFAYGDHGADNVNGESGNGDYVEGGKGPDTLSGGDGDNDVVNAVDQTGSDLAIGGAGINDICLIDGDNVGGDEATGSCEKVFELQGPFPGPRLGTAAP
jgi:Ca2+-binding RTX toxin-like protein